MSTPTPDNAPQPPQNGDETPAGAPGNPAGVPESDNVAPPAAPQYQAPAAQAAPGYAPQYGQPQPPKGLAIASLVLGIVSIVFCLLWYVSIPAGIVGVILGFVAKARQQPKNLWLWGIILGFVGIVLSIVVVVIATIILTSMINEYGTQY
ncbi:MAG: DUF4190 domain-containing protein [Canibacter sp.]